MDKNINTKINDILSKNGNRKLSMDELDMVTGGYSDSDLTREERSYILQLLQAYADACLNGKSEEELIRIEQLVFEFDRKMKEKYD